MSILIAESGSSKTDWRIIDRDGNISQFKSLGFNPYYQNEDSIYEEIEKQINNNIRHEITELYYYGTGITNSEKKDIVETALKKAFVNASIEIFDDMLAAARSLCLAEPGIACILGTGSNSCLYDGNKIIDKIPALGFWLGDEGSGGYLGKELIKKYIRNELPETIHQKFVKKYGNLERTEILEKAFKQALPNRYFAGYSKFLFNNRANPAVYLIIFEAFLLFFEKSVLKYQNFQQYKVHFTGSVAFYFSDILRKAAVKSGITVGVILESPIAGLVLYHIKKNDN